MAIKTYSDQPYHDDFTTATDKGYLRILFRPGRSVQVRELNQIQSNVQDQIDKFGRHVFKDGDRVLDGYSQYDEGIKSVAIQFINNSITAAQLNALKGKEVIKNGDTTLRAKIVGVETTTIGSDQYRLYLKYGGEGSSGTREFANADQINLAADEDTITIGSTSVAASAEIGDISTSVEAPGDYGGFFQDEGVFFVKGHFVHVDTTESFIIKDSNGKITGDLFFDIAESIVTSADDSSLLDNANGQPNINAPGADRYKIALTLKFVKDSNSDAAVEDQQRIHLLEINQDKVVSPVRTEYSELGKALAQRTEEESGSYTLKPFKHDIRQYLNDEAGNRGKYTDDEILNSPSTPLIAGVTNLGEAQTEGKKRYIVGIEPSTAYVQGYRVEFEDKQDVVVTKGRSDKETYSDYKLAATRGQYIEGSLIDDAGVLDQAFITDFVFAPNETYTLFQDESNPDVVIGTCRIHAIENTGIKTAAQDSPTAAHATKRLYIYDISLAAGKKLSDAKILHLDHDETTSDGDSYLFNNDGFTLIETGDDQSRMVYPLSGFTVEDVNVTNSKIIVQERFYEQDPSDTTVNINSAHSGGKHISTDPDDYVVVQEGTSTEDTDGEAYVKSVTLNNAGDDADLEIFMASGANPATGAGNDFTVFAPVEVPMVIRDKTQTIGSTTSTTTSLNPGDVITLDDVDVYNLTSVTHAKNPAGASANIQSDFELITGQTDTHYAKSRLVYKGSGAFESGSLVATYDRFAHGTGNVFTANSYKDSGGNLLDLEDIPKYEGLRLSNCLDFRPSVTDSTEGVGIKPDSLVTVEFDHYLPRRDIIVLTQLGEIEVITGTANKNPQYPDVPSDSLLLYQIDKPGYVYSIDDINVISSDNRRYTMRDIGDLDDRVKNLEYYTALTALENEAAGIQIQDASGDRFKNGIITDSFRGHGTGDTANGDYRVAIDRENFSARPTYLSENTRWQYKSGMTATAETSGVTSWNGDTVTSTTKYSGKRGNAVVLDHIEKTLVDQPFASGHISVNPYDVATWSGSLELSPSSDEWKDVNHVPDIVQNVEGDNNALLEQIANDPNILGTEWGEWNANWNGAPQRVSTRTSLGTMGGFEARRRFGFQATRLLGARGNFFRLNTFERDRREGIQTSLVEGTVREVIDDKLLNITFIPFIRSRKIFFKAQLLKPNTTFYMYMDDVNITSYCGETTFQQFGGNIAAAGNTDVERFDGDLPASISGTTALKTDSAGSVEGFIVIPNNDTLRFRTGSRQIRLTDSSVNNRVLELSSAESTYHAKGLLETRQRTILSTRQLVLERTRVSQNRDRLVSSRVVRRDPVAQTFMIGNEPTGIFLSSVDIFFQAEDPNLPVELSIVTVENGIPTQNTIPFSRVIKNPNEVSVDATNAQSATTFRFDTPIYLEPDIEYAIVLISNSARYRVWFAEPGTLNKVAAGQAERITKNVNLGVLLKSQNASTWTPDQNKDLKFKLKRADFKTDASQTAVFSGLCPQRGEVSYIDLDSPATGYLTGAPTITVAASGGTPATAKAYVGNGGVIDTIEVLTNGSGYDSPGGTMPTITIGARDRINIPTGSVTIADETIELPSNSIKVKSGQTFEYNNGGGTSITNLTSGDTYHAETVEKDGSVIRPVEHSRLIRLYTSSDFSGSEVNLNGTGNAAQYLLPNSPIPTATAQTDTWKASTYLPIIQDMNLPETSSTYQMHVGNGAANEYTVFPGELLYTGTRVEHDKRSGSGGSGADELKLEATLSTTDSKVSPVVDLDRISLVTFDNIITNSSEFETVRDGGESAARYITKRVILKSPADQVNVYADVMRPDDSTDIEVYAKYKYLNDDTPFDALGWTKINPVGDNKLPVNTDFEFKEVEFEGNTTTEFNELSIKVLFKSSDKAYAPEIKNLRVIATV